MNPRFHAFGHVAHPLAGVDREVADKFEGGKRGEREFRRKVTRQRTAGETRLAVDHHGAGTADAGAADEVELERRILGVAKFIESNEQRHRVGFFQLIGLHVRHALRILRVEAQDADLEHAVLLVGGLLNISHFDVNLQN